MGITIMCIIFGAFFICWLWPEPRRGQPPPTPEYQFDRHIRLRKKIEWVIDVESHGPVVVYDMMERLFSDENLTPEDIRLLNHMAVGVRQARRLR